MILNTLTNATAWNNFLEIRIGEQYGKKKSNSFIVNTVDVVSANFPEGVPQVTVQSIKTKIHDLRSPVAIKNNRLAL